MVRPIPTSVPGVALKCKRTRGRTRRREGWLECAPDELTVVDEEETDDVPANEAGANDDLVRDDEEERALSALPDPSLDAPELSDSPISLTTPLLMFAAPQARLAALHISSSSCGAWRSSRTLLPTRKLSVQPETSARTASDRWDPLSRRCTRCSDPGIRVSSGGR